MRLERLRAPASPASTPRGRWAAPPGARPAAPRLLRHSQARLFHALGNFNLPLRRVPGKAYVAHGARPDPAAHARRRCPRAFRWQFRLWLARSLGRGPDALRERAHAGRAAGALPRGRGRRPVVHNGVDHVDRGRAGSHAARPSCARWRCRSDFVLYAGSLDVRKNVSLVLDALERLRARGQPAALVLAGQSWFGSGAVETRVGRMRAEGYDIRAAGLPVRAPVFYELMRRAAVFVFPSTQEGFGLPPLEAMRLGTRPLCPRRGPRRRCAGTRRSRCGRTTRRGWRRRSSGCCARTRSGGAGRRRGSGRRPVHLGALRGRDARGLRGGASALKGGR